MKSYIRTPEHNRKISEALKGRPGWNKGLRWSDEVREKMSKTKMGHVVSDESKEKMRKAKLGKKASLETRRKLSALRKGKWHKDTVNYFSFHQRVRAFYGDIQECVYCGKNGKTEFASISHEAKHKLTDYIALCRSCHRNYDKTWLVRKRDELGRFQ